jgi:hypothetical protein
LQGKLREFVDSRYPFIKWGFLSAHRGSKNWGLVPTSGTKALLLKPCKTGI